MRLGATLYVYKGEWGLPSIDFECLRVLCLVKFTRCPVQIETQANPWRSGAGTLPYLRIGNEKFVGYTEIKSVLDREGYPVDASLELKLQPLSTSYANWVFTQLHAYYHYFMYSEPNNFETTRALYAKRTPFPFNFFYPNTYQSEAQDVVLTMAGFDTNDKLEKHETEYLVLQAKMCVNTISRKLGNRVWLFGDIFSEFDAIAYAYLSVLFRITLPNNPLQNHIKGTQNIVNFINRITKDIFKQEAFNSIKTSKSSSSNDPMLTNAERKFLESEKKTKILAGVGAVVAMGTFAAWKGLFKQFSHTDGYYRKQQFEQYDDDDELEEDEMD